MSFAFHQYVQILSVIIGLVFLKSVYQRGLLLFLLLDITGTLADAVAVWAFNAGMPNNYFAGDSYVVLATIIVFVAFYKLLDLNAKQRIWYRILASIIVILFIADFLIFTGINEITVYSNIFFNFFSILLCVAFLFQMAMRNEIFSFSSEPLFWISSGFLIFCIGSLVVMGMYQFIRSNHLTINNQNLYILIMPVLNIILYLSFAYAFLLCRVQNKSYSPS